MAGRRGKHATPAQIARNGHVAALVRAAMKQHDWNMADFSEALGMERHATSVYPWITGTGVPGPALRAKLAVLLKVPEADLLPRGKLLGTAARPMVKPTSAPAKTKTEPVQRTANGTAWTEPKPAEVVSFTTAANGAARITLDVTLPMDVALPLFHMIMDAGVIVTSGTRTKKSPPE